MKSKIVMIMAFLAVTVPMTGIGAATGIVVSNDPLTISQGGTGTQVVSVSAPGNILELTVKGANLNADGDVVSTYDIGSIFAVTIDGNPGTTLTNTSSGWAQPKDFTVTFTDSYNAPNKDYAVEYTARYLDGSTTKKTAKLTADVVKIPEFPTIALPVAAAIGLVFLVQNMKRRDED